MTGILPYQRSYAQYQRRLRRIRRRLRGGGGGIPGWVVGVGLAVAIMLAATATGATGHAVHAVTSAAGAGGHAAQPATRDEIKIPSGSSLTTRPGWAHALLAADSLPQTSCNFNAITAWMNAEGGGFGNQASFNPLNVNPPATANWPGHHAIGAWAFPDARTGLVYTVRTLNNGYYGGILAALQAANNAQAVCDAIMASPWAISHYYGRLRASC